LKKIATDKSNSHAAAKGKKENFKQIVLGRLPSTSSAAAIRTIRDLSI
jgi:hypothetical protein